MNRVFCIAKCTNGANIYYGDDINGNNTTSKVIKTFRTKQVILSKLYYSISNTKSYGRFSEDYSYIYIEIHNEENI